MHIYYKYLTLHDANPKQYQSQEKRAIEWVLDGLFNDRLTDRTITDVILDNVPITDTPECRALVLVMGYTIHKPPE